MKIKLNSKSPTRIEVLLQPGDDLDVNAELGARLLAANPSLQEPKPKPKPRTRKPPTGKGSS